MIVVASKAANIPPDVATRLGIELPDQPLIIDGVRYGVDDVTIEQLDVILKNAKTNPAALGASAADYIALLKSLLDRDREILVVSGPKAVTTTYDSAVAAVRTLSTLPAGKHATIRVVDTNLLEIGGGLVAIRCAAAIKGGAPLAEVMDICHSMASNNYLVQTLANLDSMRKSGRAPFLKTLAADFLGVVPVLHLSGGEVKPAKTVSKDADRPSVIADMMIARFGKGRAVWVGIYHGAVPTQAYDLERLLRAAFDVKYMVSRPGVHSSYAMSGRGFLGCAMVPVDDRFSGPPV